MLVRSQGFGYLGKINEHNLANLDRWIDEGEVAVVPTGTESIPITVTSGTESAVLRGTLWSHGPLYLDNRHAVAVLSALPGWVKRGAKIEVRGYTLKVQAVKEYGSRTWLLCDVERPKEK